MDEGEDARTAAMPPPAPPTRPPERKRRFPRSFGRYVLEKTLSRGGMGEVYLAIVKHLRQRCVIKTIRGDLTGEEEFVGRFADEAKILVRAAHRNIIRYFDAGRVNEDYYIAMEHVHGRDLGDVLDRAYERGEPMPPALGLFIASNLLSGLHYAHEMRDETGRRMGLVHRDISPQNVLIGFDGSVKLIDFGLARTDVLPNRTQGALAVGKYGYMSPEQARHEPLDGRADIYSAGVMLFEVFTGDRLVDEQDQSTLWQRVLNPKHRRPRSVLPSLPRDIDDLVMRAVAVRAQDRFTDAHSMARVVDDIRGPNSNEKELQSYLRHLYPRVDFSSPPLPDLSGFEDSVERSVIFATSRDGARSVFGRGELPIEGTQQINANDVRREIQRRRKLAGGKTDDQPTLRPAKNPKKPLRETQAIVSDPAEKVGHEERPTQVSRFPADEEATAFMTAPIEVAEIPSSTATIDEALLGQTGLGYAYGEDERTVMMVAPPQALFDDSESSASRAREDYAAAVFDPGAPETPLFGEDTTNEATELGPPPGSDLAVDFEELTRPGRPPRPGFELPSVTDPSAEGGRRRAIRERVRPPEPEHTAASIRSEPTKASGYPRADVSRSPPMEGPSIFLIGGLVFAIAALCVVIGLFLAR